jgi:cytosine/adenosine deaminase-related metal-dependent hydrolase
MRLLVNARNRSVGIADGRIGGESGAFEVVLDLPDAEVRPGLINCHDHLHRNHYGRLGSPPYRNAYQWAEDIQSRYRRRIARRHRWPRRSALLAGAWKNLFAGVTTVVHHDPWESEFDHAFPLRVARVATANSVRQSRDLEQVGAAPHYCLHVAEGTDQAAADEVRELGDHGLLTDRLVAVHAVGIDDDGIGRLAGCGAAVAWCPTSNLFMLGRTAPAALLNSGVDVLVGSDSLLSGAGDLLDELRFARAQAFLDDARLEAAVGAIPARRLGLPAPTLDEGAPADFILLRRPLLEARANDVALVVIDGVPRVADAVLAAKLEEAGERGTRMTVGSVERWTNARAVAEYAGSST